MTCRHLAFILSKNFSSLRSEGGLTFHTFLDSHDSDLRYKIVPIVCTGNSHFHSWPVGCGSDLRLIRYPAQFGKSYSSLIIHPPDSGARSEHDLNSSFLADDASSVLSFGSAGDAQTTRSLTPTSTGTA